MPSFRLLFALGLCGSVVGGCAAKNDAASGGDPKITGVVVDGDYAPIAGALVRVASDPNLQTQSGADGSFSLSLPQNAPSTLPIAADHLKYARATRRLPVANADSQARLIQLRAFDAAVDIELSADPAAAPATVSLNPNGVARPAVFIFAPGSLVDPNGIAVSGTVQVRAAYWGRQDPLASAPSTLQGVEADGSFRDLETYGMIDYRMSQQGVPLSVAPGRQVEVHLPLTDKQTEVFTEPQGPLPNLYRVDEKTGYWAFVSAGVAGDPNDADPLSKPQAQAQGRSLQTKNGTPINQICEKYTSPDQGDGRTNQRLIFTGGQTVLCLNGEAAWNIDGGLDPQAGGCQRGRLVNACTGQPVGNKSVSTYMLTVEQVARFDVKSRANGTFCFTTPYSSWDNSQLTQPVTAYFVPTAQNDASQTAYCNPAAPQLECFRDHNYDWNDNQSSWVSNCRIGFTNKDYSYTERDLSTTRYPFIMKEECTSSKYAPGLKKPPIMQIFPCTYCSGSVYPKEGKACSALLKGSTISKDANDASCFNLGDIKVPDGTCTCDRYGNCNQRCTKPKGIGDSCYVNPTDPQNADKFQACCSNSDDFPLGTLTCQDDICILSSSLPGHIKK